MATAVPLPTPLPTVAGGNVLPVVATPRANRLIVKNADEYVDLQSRLRNLEATWDRIRTFLDQAQNVEEALKVNAELKTVEIQIYLPRESLCES